MKVYLRGDNAGVTGWRSSEVAACPDQSDLHRQELCFSRKTTKLIYRRRSVAWRIARVATFTARVEGGGGYRTPREVPARVRHRPAPPTLQDGRAVRRAPAPTGDYRAFLLPNEQMRGEST